MRTPQGLRVAGNVIPQQPTLSNMTKSELAFSLLVEEVSEMVETFPSSPNSIFLDVEPHTTT